MGLLTFGVWVQFGIFEFPTEEIPATPFNVKLVERLEMEEAVVDSLILELRSIAVRSSNSEGQLPMEFHMENGGSIFMAVWFGGSDEAPLAHRERCNSSIYTGSIDVGMLSDLTGSSLDAEPDIQQGRDDLINRYS